jgi:DNA-binding CsgD family transcriptional regulator
LFSQNEVYFFKDVNNKFSVENIKEADFKKANSTILDKQTDVTYWFKIPSNKTDLDYIFRFSTNRIKNANAYQNSKEVLKIPNERYIAFKFDRDSSIYIRVNSDYTAHYPFSLAEESESNYNEKLQLLLSGFYYGFSFLVIIYCFFYYYFFKDDAYFYYALFLSSLVLSFTLIDGLWSFFKAPQNTIDIAILLNYIFIAFFSSKFIQSFLVVDNYYPKLKKYTYSLGILIILMVLLYLLTKNHDIFIVINILVFVIFFIYWFVGVLLFKNNIYIKIFVFAYVTILFSGIDFFVLKKLGYSLFETNAIGLKIGGFIQIIVLSVAVLFREKTLRASNYLMKSDIIEYSKEIERIILHSKDETQKDVLQSLSVREREIFDLITLGNSNKIIGNTLNISVNTVKFHVKNIYEKLDIKSRKEAITLEKSFNL